jgi:hypothetical protein
LDINFLCHSKGISTEFIPFSNRESDLVIQYQMKHDQKIECGGGYIKVGPKPDDMTAFGDPTPYYIMFGPDQCGGTHRIHVILNYKGKNHLKKQDIYFSPSDKRSHLLTLIIRPDNTYTVNVDMEEKSDTNFELQNLNEFFIPNIDFDALCIEFYVFHQIFVQGTPVTSRRILTSSSQRKSRILPCRNLRIGSVKMFSKRN